MQIAVIGAADATAEECETAGCVGRLLAESHATLICGGLGGVTVGILPDTGDGNQYLDIRIRSGLGHARNVLIVQSADAVIAIGGKYGALSEIAIALKLRKPVFGLKTWDIEGVVACGTPEDAVLRAVRAARRSP